MYPTCPPELTAVAGADESSADANLYVAAAHLRLLLTTLALEADQLREKLSLLTGIDGRFIEAEMRAAEMFSAAAALEQRVREISTLSNQLSARTGNMTPF